VSFLRTAAAFLKKDLLEQFSYRFALLFQLAGLVLLLFFVAVFSEFVGGLVEAKLARYEGSYFAFVVVGLGLYSFLEGSVYHLSRGIRRAQVIGTLEALLATRTSMPTLVMCVPLYALLGTSLRVLVILLFGALFFDMPLRTGNLPAALLVFALTVAAFGGLGLFVAGLTIAFKRSEPVAGLISIASLLLGGVYFPVDALPEWLERASVLTPLTPALEGLRLCLLADVPFAELRPSVLGLVAFAALLVPCGAAFFRWSLRRAMRDGTLTQY